MCIRDRLFFATSPVLTRWADPLSPYEKTAGRLAVATLVVFALMRLRKEPFKLSRQSAPLFLVFGLIAALHFLTYIASLNYTTIAHSLAIVYTAPIFVTLFSAWFLKEPIPRRKWGGVLIAVLGVAILAGFEPRWNSTMAVSYTHLDVYKRQAYWEYGKLSRSSGVRLGMGGGA